MIEVLKGAKKHIHLEYYIFNEDEIGVTLGEVLREKAQERVKVRFLYDALGSKLSQKFIKKLENGGVEVPPFNKIYFQFFANRVNYRDHRKIIIVDGSTAFTRGINVADKYINKEGNKVYWRDTHLMIKGDAVFYLQYLFLSSWIFTGEKMVSIDESYFPKADDFSQHELVQIAASGSDTRPIIMQSTVSMISSAKTSLFITTAYFISTESVLFAIKNAALSGVEVRIIVSYKSDSILVNAAAFSYFTDILDPGAKIYKYKKGFVHAKTIIVDGEASIVGTANMEIRSYELNFEVNAIVYDKKVSSTLKNDFLQDLGDCDEIDAEKWANRSRYKQFFEHLARLLSPLL